MESKIKKILSIKNIHLLVLLLGIIFISLGIFHTNLWFDETYSVAIADHSFAEIWTIGGNDVHPILYYWMLKIISLLTGSSIIAYRIFSMLGIAVLGILGYTHIRKDFGEKTGLLFSFFSFFMAEMPIYANEVRMYSWAITFASICAIYAYRIFKNENSNKNWIIFFISSLASIYTHYYGLMAAGLINLALFIYLIIKKRKKDIIKIIIFGIAQLLLYAPWLLYFVKQLGNVSGGFWIGFSYPDTIIELLFCQMTGGLNRVMSAVIITIIYTLIVVLACKEKKENKKLKPAILSISIYFAVIIAAIIMTALLHTSIVYYRYLFVITGLLIFTISYVLANQENNKLTIFICTIVAIMGIMTNCKMVKENYSSNNNEVLAYLEKNLQENDEMVYLRIGNGAITAVNFKDYKQYFYNPENWGVEEAYKAYSPQMDTYVTTDFIETLGNRVWLIDDDQSALYDTTFKDRNDYKMISSKEFKADYHNLTFNIYLLEKQ